MAIILTVPAHQAPSPVYCPLPCDHDQCMKYNNEAMKFFYRCHSGWSGVHCHIPIRCDDCSSDSICLGSINNRSICLCPLNKIYRVNFLAALQEFTPENISTSINPTQRCAPIEELLEFQQFILPKIRRMKFYYRLGQNYQDLICFFNESFMCLFTFERHINCFKFDHHLNLTCQNGAECLEDIPTCPLTIICVCTDCFFGDRC
ncbi:unnamed protein product [Rotaria sp. Silwood1]|nr:unnamed protein product [Rotaria sp. Silwood1]CAF1365596.1 unnamed protein product [Rotaria sp. Silwood1]CAF3544629.1 unnamed protein product [Rotaria sp. Silwood1]CAF3604204.1 unnamed protein product [Rotaria sp. Silwood1]CAF4632865.1 unnamed protein product [Rotaria sp. Silwood1]